MLHNKESWERLLDRDLRGPDKNTQVCLQSSSKKTRMSVGSSIIGNFLRCVT